MRFSKLILLIICFLAFSYCNERNVKIRYSYIEPKYDQVQMKFMPDTITFELHETTYNTIKSFNYFSSNGNEYMSFYDERSGSINIYDFHTRNLVKRILLKNLLQRKKLYKTTVFVKNFDSLLITNKTKLILLDSSGKVKRKFEFLENPSFAWAYFDNTSSVVFKDSQLYMAVRPYVNETSFRDLKEWKVLYGFDTRNGKAKLYYGLPDVYTQKLLGYRFLNYSYCFNSRGRFVFSFPADTLIYETDFKDYHVSYFGKSQFQKNPIMAIPRKNLKESNDAFREYLLRDSYGAIYFDPNAKRYLRVAKTAISETAYNSNVRNKKQHLIIFNEQFKIIGESEVNKDILLNSIFISKEGQIYARTKAADEYALHFVRMTYSDDKTFQTIKIAKHEIAGQ